MPAVPLDLGQARVGFERDLQDARGPVRLSDDRIGVPEGRLHVPPPRPYMAGDVGRGPNGGPGPFGKDRLEVGDRGQRVDGQPDGPGRALRGLAGRGGHGRDRLARVVDRLAGERGPLGISDPPAGETRDVSRGDRAHPGNGPRRGEIDRPDPSVRNGSEDERPPEHALGGEVRPEDRDPAHLVARVRPDRPHSFTFRCAPATARTIAA